MSHRSDYRAALAERNILAQANGDGATMPITIVLNGHQLDPILVPLGAHPDIVERHVRTHPFVAEHLRHTEYSMTYAPVSGRFVIVTQQHIRIPRMI